MKKDLHRTAAEMPVRRLARTSVRTWCCKCKVEVAEEFCRLGKHTARRQRGKNIGCCGDRPLDLHVPVLDNHISVSGTLTDRLPATAGDRFEVVLEDAPIMNPY
jgi:hypothetical protein